jgi:hypothetical protein
MKLEKVEKLSDFDPKGSVNINAINCSSLMGCWVDPGSVYVTVRLWFWILSKKILGVAGLEVMMYSRADKEEDLTAYVIHPICIYQYWM